MPGRIKYPSQAYLNSVLSYDPVTGVLTWAERQDVHPYWNRLYAHSEAGTINGLGYRQIYINGQGYLGHRLIWIMQNGEPDTTGWMIDHKDGNRSNNAWLNLRLATKSQNNINKPAFGSSTGFRGVYKKNSGKFRAAISVNGKYIHIGTFETVDDARSAYAEAARMYHGDFARVD